MIKYSRALPLIFLHLLLLSPQALLSQSKGFLPLSARNSALGGAHAALTDEVSTILNNAAGFRGVESDLTVSEMTLKLMGPLSTLILAAQEGDFQGALGKLGTTTIGAELNGPISIGKITNNMAFSIFSNFNTELFIPNLTQNATIDGFFDLGGIYGYSFGIDLDQINSELNFGFTTKLFFRSSMRIEKSFQDIMSAFSDISSLISPDSLPLGFGFGIGLDLGMKFIWIDTISVAFSVRDIYTPLFMFDYPSITSLSTGGQPQFKYSTISGDYSIGFMYSPQVSFLNGLIGGFQLLFDYNDIFDFVLNSANQRHPLLHISLGFEMKLFRILALRMGFNEGLPAFGFGMDLHLFKFNLSMFGRELGRQPGIMSVYNLMVGIDFSY